MGCSLTAINHKVEAPMRLKNTLIVVEDINKSVAFYKELFGLQVIRDFDGNVIMTEGLVLQERKIFEKFISRECTPRNNMSELYFEEADIDKFVEKLESSSFKIEYVNKFMTHSWGQSVVRFYDPDGNLIEVGTPV